MFAEIYTAGLQPETLSKQQNIQALAPVDADEVNSTALQVAGRQPVKKVVQPAAIACCIEQCVPYKSGNASHGRASQKGPCLPRGVVHLPAQQYSLMLRH